MHSAPKLAQLPHPAPRPRPGKPCPARTVRPAVRPCAPTPCLPAHLPPIACAPRGPCVLLTCPYRACPASACRARAPAAPDSFPARPAHLQRSRSPSAQLPPARPTHAPRAPQQARLRHACVPRAPPTRLRAVSLCRAPSPVPSLLLKWAVAHFRFCAIFFFHFFQPLENTKNIFIYFLSFSSTPINLLKLISFFLYRYIFFSFSNKPNKLLKFILRIFLFQFTHCKLQGLFSNMPMCYLPKHTNINITHTTCHTHQTHTYNHSSIHMITHKTHMPCPSFVLCLS